MTLSRLQRYILLTAWESTKAKIPRENFNRFYLGVKSAPLKKLQANIITTSLERMIERGLLIGYGYKTQHKLFIEQVKLTPQGKKIARLIFSRQATFPWSKKR